MTPHSAEIAYLKRLIEDFPAGVSPEDAERAHQKIASRYSALEQVHQQLVKEYLPLNPQSTGLSIQLKQLAYATHGFLFDKILSNAGEVRKKTDPKGGRIGFGGSRHQQQRSKFTGTTPPQIISELDDAFSHLVYSSDNPIENAMRFYQHFVYIHPFYDGNGRIGRIIVSIYLHLFDCYVQWEEFDGPNKRRKMTRLKP